ncbi:MAG: IS1096 element passenger TnpR family protein [Planctomycetota bacterium]
MCVEGERACPPEDCGGPYHYGDLVAIIHDAKKATKEMRKIK